MVSDLFVNMTILISFITLSGYVFREDKPPFQKDSFKIKVVMGILLGVLGIILMIYTIKVPNTNTIVDLRIIILMMSYYSFGLFSTAISGIIIGIFRLTYGLNESSIIAIISIISIILSFSIIEKFSKKSAKSWLFMLISSLCISIFSLYFLLRKTPNVLYILSSYFIVTSISAALVYVILEYVNLMNETYRRLKISATKDFLTGLNNTRMFDNILNEYVENAKINKQQLSCIMIDIDHFKKVNDTYGHPIGDLVLKQLGEILLNSVTSMDKVSRIGGEEFCVILPDCEKSRAIEVAERIRQTVKDYTFFTVKNKGINISISAGISTLYETSGSPESFIKQADEALYMAKHSGRDRVCDGKICYIL